LIFDSDIVVWMLRKHRGVIRFAEELQPHERHLSCVSHLELLHGCRNARELKDLSELVDEWFREVLPLTPVASSAAVEIMEKFALSHRPDVGDALIAGTALERREPVATANLKHFDFIPGLSIKPFRP
jgi:predicted nucleic acid-binding protein